MTGLSCHCGKKVIRIYECRPRERAGCGIHNKAAMVIIRMKGGLGNQMFQYALYCELRYLGRQVKMDDVTGFRSDRQRDPALSVFGIEYDRASTEQITKITDSYMDPLSRIRRKLFGRHSLEYEEKDGNYDPAVQKMADAYLVGFWQSQKYFQDTGVRKELRENFLQNESQILQSSAARELQQRMAGTESVSLHIRRGDYLDPGTVETFGGICTTQYYRQAVAMIRKRYPCAVFYVFSNDVQWVREHITEEDFIPVDPASIGSDAAELLLMSKCRHHILANSSFSWWGAWLGEHEPDQLTIVPSKWLNNKKMDDIYTEYMTRITGEIE